MQQPLKALTGPSEYRVSHRRGAKDVRVSSSLLRYELQQSLQVLIAASEYRVSHRKGAKDARGVGLAVRVHLQPLNVLAASVCGLKLLVSTRLKLLVSAALSY